MPVLQKPMPMPSRKAPVPAHNSPFAGVKRISTTLPITRVRPPMVAANRYEVRIIRRPAAMLAKAQLTDEAANTTPAAVASPPIAPCT